MKKTPINILMGAITGTVLGLVAPFMYSLFSELLFWSSLPVDYIVGSEILCAVLCLIMLLLAERIQQVFGSSKTFFYVACGLMYIIALLLLAVFFSIALINFSCFIDAFLLG